MKIAFISTRGIPNNYGGFEQFAEYISVGLARRGHDVTVYSPHFHPYKDNLYKGVRIRHVYSPEQWMGSSVGSFFYDFLSLKDALKREDFDIVYVAGYTSVVPAYIRFNVRNINRPAIVTNMDGLEYKRTKFNRPTRKFLAWEERTAVRYSRHIVADNSGVRDYYRERYGRESKFLAYGANVSDDYSESFLREFDLRPRGYYLQIARLEPENNIEMVANGYLLSDRKTHCPLIVVGKTDTPHGKYLVGKYGGEKSVRFVGGIYDFDKLNSLRHFSSAYFHGHSVGGTNPSLLEAMASGCFIVAGDNVFNASVLHDDALYFSSDTDVCAVINSLETEIKAKRDVFVANNLERIKTEYSWEKLTDEYERYFLGILNGK